MLELHLDPVGGIAGDMFAAALLGLRPDLAEGLTRTLAACPLLEGVTCELVAHTDGVLTGHRFLVRRETVTEPAAQVPAATHSHGHHDHAHDHHHAHDHEHGEGDGHHHHAHDHIHDRHHDHGHHHSHTHWRLIREALTHSSLDRETVTHAIGIFALLAEAEGRVHGLPADDVSFHEVGAWDSIADIVAAGWLISQLGATRWTVGPVPLGSGRIQTAHGLLPVPAPATALLLEGFALIDDGIGGERVTPTGAAILRYLCGKAARIRTPRRLQGSSHGFGTRHMPGISNCLRVLAFETEVETASTIAKETIAVLECEIDDQTGEDLAQAINLIRARTGVLDVIQAPVFGKKGRMMTHLRILAAEADLDAIVATVFDETTTIGIRQSLVTRNVLARRLETVDIEGRAFRLKTVQRPGGTTSKLEAEELDDVRSSHRRSALRQLVATRSEKRDNR